MINQPMQIFDELDLKMEKLRHALFSNWCECPKHGRSRAFVDNSCRECYQEKSIVHQERRHEEQILHKKKLLTTKSEFINARFTNYRITNKDQEEIVNYLHRYTLGKNILFNGLPGCGKTHLAWAFIDKLLRENISVHYFNYYDLAEIKNKQPEVFIKSLKCQMIVIDEIGLVDSEKGDKSLDGIIEAKYKNGNLMLITNLIDRQFEVMMTKSSYSKFRENLDQKVATWQDYRLKGK